MFKKIVSYVYPMNVMKQNSAFSKNLEVTWTNGYLVLDSRNTNYSYGSLQRILKIGLKNIGFEKIKKMNHILVLGVAGGSVIKTLVEEIQVSAKITGVEIDKEVIEIANLYFNLNKIPNLEIVIEDAFEFTLKTKTKYDLIIVDVFCDTHMPNFLFEDFFRERICFLLQPKGNILFNTMCLNEIQNQRNIKYVEQIPKDYFVKTIPRVEQHNELIIIEKK
ncbi:methyltransferase domain-containing protein [Flavobacterium sp. NST-5]|uniref:Methyltransferase domain-containing protein n=1 Tax=Flavobacterium ichthyis TaxID=2698827 RepID=A0ABW9Z8I7_9FLAO|nr:methyltransferase domain-containing protein [Flavobacterium ichthyis]NBL65211.1 methyltransferase domain-containing protein [Flavobacterium ichthyis]